jgi:hypothetical protein
MLYRETVVVYSRIFTEVKNILWGQNAELFNMKRSAIYATSNHRTSKGHKDRAVYLHIKCLNK